MSQTTSQRDAARAGEIPAIIDTVRGLDVAATVSLTRPSDANTVPVLIVPNGKQVLDVKKFLDAYLPAPERRKGTATLTDLASFIEHTNRFKDDDSVVFAHRDEENPALTAVLDYHRAGAAAAPRFGTHRGQYAFPVSEQWEAWAEVDGKALDQATFAAFLEERIADVLLPPTDPAALGGLAESLLQLIGDTTAIAGPTKMMEISRGLRVKEHGHTVNAQTLSTGEIEAVFKVEHRDEAGQPLRVPSLFLVGIPVFDGGAPYRLPIRILYRVAGGRITWFLKRYRPELIFLNAFDEAVAEVKEKTTLPVFMGAPEA